MKERRQHPRFETLNFVYYIMRDDGSFFTQDMGRTLDASKSGLLIETRVPLVEGLQIQMDIALADAILNLTGVVIYSRKSEDESHHSGIKFNTLDADKRQQLMGYLQQSNLEKP